MRCLSHIVRHSSAQHPGQLSSAPGRSRSFRPFANSAFFPSPVAQPNFTVRLEDFSVYGPLRQTPVNVDWAPDLQASLHDPISPSPALLAIKDYAMSTPWDQAEIVVHQAHLRDPELFELCRSEKVRSCRPSTARVRLANFSSSSRIGPYLDGSIHHCPETSAYDTSFLDNVDFAKAAEVMKSRGLGGMNSLGAPRRKKGKRK
jgi:hypothetical protein